MQLYCHTTIQYTMKELTGALRKSNVRQASYLGARLASFDTNNDGHISIGELGKWIVFSIVCVAICNYTLRY